MFISTVINGYLIHECTARTADELSSTEKTTIQNKIMNMANALMECKKIPGMSLAVVTKDEVTF